MWKIEIAYKYSGIISHLVFDTKEQAELERNKLLPLIGKDRFDLKQNDGHRAVTIIDKYGTVDVDVSEVKAVRCYDGASWDKESIKRNSEYEREMAKARKID